MTEKVRRVEERSYWMGPAEWLGVSTLSVAALAFLVAALTLLNQMASFRRPLPAVDLLHGERLMDAIVPGQQNAEPLIGTTLVFRVANRGHETMFNPTVHDWTPNSALIESEQHLAKMPKSLSPGESCEVVIDYSLTNEHERLVGIVWEEASLFGRMPRTMGLRFRSRPNFPVKVKWVSSISPAERWKRVGPFRKKGWKRKGSVWSGWNPVWSGPKEPHEGAVWTSSSEDITMDLFDRYRLVRPQPDQKSIVAGRGDITSERFVRYQERGKLLPKD